MQEHSFPILNHSTPKHNTTNQHITQAFFWFTRPGQKKFRHYLRGSISNDGISFLFDFLILHTQEVPASVGSSFYIKHPYQLLYRLSWRNNPFQHSLLYLWHPAGNHRILKEKTVEMLINHAREFDTSKRKKHLSALVNIAVSLSNFSF